MFSSRDRELATPVWSPRPVDATAVVLTDDWPFTYARGKYLPSEYLSALALVVLMSILGLRVVGGQQSIREWHFFFLGAGFLLLETRNITSLAIAFGSTWYVNSVVFFSILTMALGGAILVSRMERDWRVAAYVGLLLAIAANMALPVEIFTGFDFWHRVTVVGGLTALPLFFSGIVFSQSFKRALDPAGCLAANVLGGVFGGVLEYASMLCGLRFLLVLAASLYVLSLLAMRSRPRTATT